LHPGNNKKAKGQTGQNMKNTNGKGRGIENHSFLEFIFMKSIISSGGIYLNRKKENLVSSSTSLAHFVLLLVVVVFRSITERIKRRAEKRKESFTS
jgi:hypothetical protein